MSRQRSRSITQLVGLLGAAFALAVPAVGAANGAEPAAREVVEAQRVEGAVPAPVRPRPLSPRMAEIRALIDAQSRGLRELSAAYAAAASHAEALEVERRVQELKLNTEVEIFRVQARYAVAEGRTADAAKAEAAIEALLAPPVRVRIEAPTPPSER